MGIVKIASVNANRVAKFQSTSATRIRQLVTGVGDVATSENYLLINGSDFLTIDNQDNKLIVRT